MSGGEERWIDVPKRGAVPEQAPEGFVAEVLSRVTAGSSASTVSGSAAVLSPKAVLLMAAVGLLVVLGAFAAFGNSGGGEGSPTLNADGVPFFVCPGDGEVGSLEASDEVEVVGQSGEWLAVATAESDLAHVFVHADFFDNFGDVDDLEVETCDVAALLGVAIETSTSTTADVSTTGPEATTTTAPKTTNTTVKKSTTTTSGSAASTNTTTTTTVPGSSTTTSTEGTTTTTEGTTTTTEGTTTTTEGTTTTTEGTTTTTEGTTTTTETTTP